jgi:hypothetical protein
MDARFGKILLFILCGALLLIAGCTTTAPSGGAAPTPTEAPQVSAANPDLGTIISLLRTIDTRVSTVVENTRPQGRGILTGNMVLFDNQGNTANTITNGSSVVALPQGNCDVAIYSLVVRTFTTMEETKSYETTLYSRNKQSCFDVYLCRRTVTTDSDFPYLYITYKPYDSSKRLSQVTLSYRCQAY